MARKKSATTKKKVEEPTLKVVKTDELEFKGRSASSKYTEIIEATKALKPGQSVVIPGAPAGVDPDSHRNRISSAVRRLVNAKTGFPHRLRIRTTEEGDLAISCESKG